MAKAMNATIDGIVKKNGLVIYNGPITFSEGHNIPQSAWYAAIPLEPAETMRLKDDPFVDLELSDGRKGRAYALERTEGILVGVPGVKFQGDGYLQ